MLGKNDLIFLGACIFLNKEHWSPGDAIDRKNAIKWSRDLFDEIFQDEDKENMILE